MPKHINNPNSQAKQTPVGNTRAKRKASANYKEQKNLADKVRESFSKSAGSSKPANKLTPTANKMMNILNATAKMAQAPPPPPSVPPPEQNLSPSLEQSTGEIPILLTALQDQVSSTPPTPTPTPALVNSAEGSSPKQMDTSRNILAEGSAAKKRKRTESEG